MLPVEGDRKMSVFIAKRIKETRIAANLSQEEAAKEETTGDISGQEGTAGDNKGQEETKEEDKEDETV